MLFAGTFTYLKTVSNGGNVTSSSGFDIVFTSDAGCTTVLPFEIDNYDGSSGAVAFWVQIASLSHTVDTVIYLCYDNSAVTTSQENAATVWSSYAGVWHANAVGGVTALVDSTGANSMPGAGSGTITEVTGQIGKAFSYPGSPINSKSSPTGLPSGNGARTLSLWFKMAGTSGGSYALFGWGAFATGQRWQPYYNSNRLIQDIGGNEVLFNWTFDTNWHYLATTLPASGNLNQALMYLDGSAQTLTLETATVNTTNSSVQAAQLVGSSGTFLLNGILDEIRVSSSVRPADWIATEYNNQNSPSTFYTISGASGSATGGNGCVFVICWKSATGRIASKGSHAGFRNRRRNAAGRMLKASELSQRLLGFGKEMFLRREQLSQFIL